MNRGLFEDRSPRCSLFAWNISHPTSTGSRRIKSATPTAVSTDPRDTNDPARTIQSEGLARFASNANGRPGPTKRSGAGLKQPLHRHVVRLFGCSARCVRDEEHVVAVAEAVDDRVARSRRSLAERQAPEKGFVKRPQPGVHRIGAGTEQRDGHVGQRVEKSQLDVRAFEPARA